MLKKIIWALFIACIILPAIYGQTDVKAVLPAPRYFPNLVEGGNNMWTITFYNDASPIHDQWATQRICFRYVGQVGTHDRYVWYSISFPDWNGWATQEGDEIVMHGDYARNNGHDAMHWDIVTVSKKNEGYGIWAEWREDNSFGRTIGFGNAKLVRVGSCLMTEDEARDSNMLPLDEKGNLIEDPMGIFTEKLEN